MDLNLTELNTLSVIQKYINIHVVHMLCLVHSFDPRNYDSTKFAVFLSRLGVSLG